MKWGAGSLKRPKKGRLRAAKACNSTRILEAVFPPPSPPQPTFVLRSPYQPSATDDCFPAIAPGFLRSRNLGHEADGCGPRLREEGFPIIWMDMTCWPAVLAGLGICARLGGVLGGGNTASIPSRTGNTATNAEVCNGFTDPIGGERSEWGKIGPVKGGRTA